jgi:hypothetical protein
MKIFVFISLLYTCTYLKEENKLIDKTRATKFESENKQVKLNYEEDPRNNSVESQEIILSEEKVSLLFYGALLLYFGVVLSVGGYSVISLYKSA